MARRNSFRPAVEQVERRLPPAGLSLTSGTFIPSVMVGGNRDHEGVAPIIVLGGRVDWTGVAPPPNSGGVHGTAWASLSAASMGLPASSADRAMAIGISTYASSLEGEPVAVHVKAVDPVHPLQPGQKLVFKVVPDPSRDEHDGDPVDVNLFYDYIRNPVSATKLLISYSSDGGPTVTLPTPGSTKDEPTAPDVVIHTQVGKTIAISVSLDMVYTSSMPTAASAGLGVWATVSPTFSIHPPTPPGQFIPD